MICTCIYPPNYTIEQIAHAKETLGLEAVILYRESWSKIPQIKEELGLKVGSIGPRSTGTWVNSALNLDFIFIGDETNVTGPSGKYVVPEIYYENARVVANDLKTAGYQGTIVSASLAGVNGLFSKWFAKVDIEYLRRIVVLENTNQRVFDAYGLNPFHMNIPRALRDMRSVIGNAPIYTAGFGFNNHSFDDKVAMWTGAFTRQVRDLEADPQVVTTSTWCAGVYEALGVGQAQGMWGHIKEDGDLTISGKYFKKAVEKVKS